MKIDIHVHTRKTKRGDALTREVTPERFSQIVQSTDVKIMAITNHNVFDLVQYNQIELQLNGSVQVWPGIELDVMDDGKRSHLIVIVPPNQRVEFSNKINTLTNGYSPDEFKVSLEDTVACFLELNSLYIAHYSGKKPDMSEASIEKLISLGINPKRVIKEATNAISAGIFIAHGHSSLYGSDIHDWDNYAKEALKLPELRLAVDSFEHFCLLLEKNVPAIDTAIQYKYSEIISLEPFEDNTKVTIRAFNDINVIFGPKGTGKTKILEAIAKYYSNRGVKATVFESAPDRLADRFDIKGKNIELNIEQHDIKHCSDEINRIKLASESDITSLYNYREFFQFENKNKNANKMKIKDIPSLSSESSSRQFNDYNESLIKVTDMIKFLKTNNPVKDVITDEDRTELVERLTKLAKSLKNTSWKHYCDWKSQRLTDTASQCFREQVARKTGERSKPTDTGFKLYANNRLNIYRDVRAVSENINKEITDHIDVVGLLGREKGLLKCATSYIFQSGSIHDASYLPMKSIRKGDQKEFVRLIIDIKEKVFADDLFDLITSLNAVVDIDKILKTSDLLLFWRRFTLSDVVYSPSNGECSMLNLHSELAEDKEIYLLDEPERSLGNEYINDVIIPLINEKALQGKKVFISTHDANIAVRTLPYNSIYRCHDQDGYGTYVGNPFSNSLICVDDCHKTLDWKHISMKTLEGGENAFGERGKIYGQN